MRHLFKYLFLSGFIALFVLASAPQAIAQQSVVAHKPGALVILDHTVYVIGKGIKRGFPSLNEFLTYHYRLSRLVAGNAADAALVEGPPIHAKPGSLTVDLRDMQTVYLIGKDGEKKGFTSQVSLKKYRKKKSVIWPIDLSAYPLGSPIE
jgi:hypothetical protein